MRHDVIYIDARVDRCGPCQQYFGDSHAQIGAIGVVPTSGEDAYQYYGQYCPACVTDLPIKTIPYNTRYYYAFDQCAGPRKLIDLIVRRDD